MIEYLAANMWQVWAVVSIVCLILELSSGDFFIICFSIGAVFGAVAAAVGMSIYWQLALFALFSILSIFFVRPVALRYLHKNEDNRVSNADALIGRIGKVTETVEADGFGWVAIDGDVWKAVTHAEKDIPVGAKVKVVGRDSIIITVEIV